MSKAVLPQSPAVTMRADVCVSVSGFGLSISMFSQFSQSQSRQCPRFYLGWKGEVGEEGEEIFPCVFGITMNSSCLPLPKSEDGP